MVGDVLSGDAVDPTLVFATGAANGLGKPAFIVTDGVEPPDLLPYVAPPALPATRPAAGPDGGSGDGPLRAEYRQYSWKRGEPPVRMIAKDEGFCFLSEVGGHFGGDGEAASVYVGEDGFWYLGGHAGLDIHAKAYSVRIARGLVAAVEPPAGPADAAWRDALAGFARGNDAATRDPAVRELTAVPSAADDLMALADQWERAGRDQPVERRRAVEAHVLRLYEAAEGKLSGEPLAAARRRFAAVRLALAGRRLNDLAAWKVQGGNWSATPEGRIEGRGESELVFGDDLPADCLIEFRVNAVQGMRTRVHFGGTELYANGELMARGTRKSVPDRLGLSLSAGDGWDRGTTRFGDFKVSAAE